MKYRDDLRTNASPAPSGLTVEGLSDPAVSPPSLPNFRRLPVSRCWEDAFLAAGILHVTLILLAGALLARLIPGTVQTQTCESTGEPHASYTDPSNDGTTLFFSYVVPRPETAISDIEEFNLNRRLS